MRTHLSPLTLVVSVVLFCAYYAHDNTTAGDELVLRADLFGGWIISTIVSFASKLLTNDPGSTGATVGRAVLNLQKDLGDLGRGLKDFVGEMRDWLGSLVGLFKRFRDNALEPFLRWVRDHISRLKTWLRKIFGPTIAILKTIRSRILEFYQKFVRPVLEVIEAMRFVLGLLGRLGVKWAAELDGKLAKLESAIIRNFQAVLAHLNRVIDTVNSVVTLDLLFERVPFLRSLIRDAGYVSRIWWNTNLAAVQPPAGREGAGEIYEPRSARQDADALREFARTGGGPAAGIIRELGAMMVDAAEGRAK